MPTNHPGRGRPRIMLAFAAAFGLSIILGIKPTLADPIWNVHITGSSIGDYISSHPGNELRVSYQVDHLGPSGDANNLILASLKTNNGLSIGVLSVDLDPPLDSFTPIYTLSSNNVVLNGNGNYMAPYEIGGFTLTSSYLTLVPGTANANAEHDVPFNSVSVEVPGVVPEPGTLGLLALGALVLRRRRRR